MVDISQPVMGHVVGLITLLGVYVGYQTIGRVMTGRRPYWFLDSDVVGLDWMAVYAAGFIALGPLRM